MYAIIKTGGKQYKVSKGDSIRVESLQAEVGQSIELDQVLMTSDGSKVLLGSPFLDGVKVKASVVSVGREKKITVIKFRRRKDSRLKQGHRQYYTELKIDDILTPGSKQEKTKESKPKKAAPPKKKEEKVVAKKTTKATPKKSTASPKKVSKSTASKKEE
jgi:large subunit ribosomal protein L21